MKLQQNQIWKKEADYILIVKLERLEVRYKAFQDLVTRVGNHQTVSKKEFCRLIKGAVLMSPEEIKTLTAGIIGSADQPAPC